MERVRSRRSPEGIPPAPPAIVVRRRGLAPPPGARLPVVANSTAEPSNGTGPRLADRAAPEPPGPWCLAHVSGTCAPHGSIRPGCSGSASTLPSQNEMVISTLWRRVVTIGPTTISTLRSEERRVGKEWRSQWAQEHSKKKDTNEQM